MSLPLAERPSTSSVRDDNASWMKHFAFSVLRENASSPLKSPETINHKECQAGGGGHGLSNASMGVGLAQ